MYKTPEDIRNRLAEHLAIVKKTYGAEYTILGVFLIGSQNYGTSSENSDVDSKAILIPTYRTMVMNGEWISTTLTLENDEHIVIKDIRLAFKELKKPSINAVEWLYTKYCITNCDCDKVMDSLYKIRDSISTMDCKRMMRSTLDHLNKTHKLLNRLTEEEPGSDKWYKTYAEIMRFYNFLTIYPKYGFEQAMRNHKGIYDLQHICNVKHDHIGIDRIVTIDKVVDSATTLVDMSHPNTLSKFETEVLLAQMESIILEAMSDNHKVSKFGSTNNYFIRRFK